MGATYLPRIEQAICPMLIATRCRSSTGQGKTPLLTLSLQRCRHKLLVDMNRLLMVTTSVGFWIATIAV